MTSKNFVPANHKRIDYMGRIDYKNPLAPTVVFAGSQIRTVFTGTSIKMTLVNHHHYYQNAIGVVVDKGEPYKIVIPKDEEEVTLTLVEGLERGSHELIVYKVHDGAHYIDFKGFTLEEGEKLLAPMPKPLRRMECFGDSISVGSIVEANDYVAQPDPDNDGEYCNSWYSYISMTARNLKAQLHNTSQGGMALLDGTGYFRSPDTIGMLSTYDKIKYNTELGETTSWDFKKYIPHVVVIAIGQNDSYPEDYMRTDEEKRKTWMEAYKDFIRTLRGHYPRATFILTTTLLQHDEAWDEAITQAQVELGDVKVHRYIYKRNGKATPGHVRVIEAQEMAEELTVFIKSLGEEVWKD